MCHDLSRTDKQPATMCVQQKGFVPRAAVAARVEGSGCGVQGIRDAGRETRDAGSPQGDDANGVARISAVVREQNPTPNGHPLLTSPIKGEEFPASPLLDASMSDSPLATPLMDPPIKGEELPANPVMDTPIKGEEFPASPLLDPPTKGEVSPDRDARRGPKNLPLDGGGKEGVNARPVPPARISGFAARDQGRPDAKPSSHSAIEPLRTPKEAGTQVVDGEHSLGISASSATPENGCRAPKVAWAASPCSGELPPGSKPPGRQPPVSLQNTFPCIIRQAPKGRLQAGPGQRPGKGATQSPSPERAAQSNPGQPTSPTPGSAEASFGSQTSKRPQARESGSKLPHSKDAFGVTPSAAAVLPRFTRADLALMPKSIVEGLIRLGVPMPDGD
jgi:hypothetical protein